MRDDVRKSTEKDIISDYNWLLDLENPENHYTYAIRLSLEKHGAKETRKVLKRSLDYKIGRLTDDITDCKKIIKNYLKEQIDDKCVDDYTKTFVRLIISFVRDRRYLKSVLKELEEGKIVEYKGVKIPLNGVVSKRE